jgi:hypothetical protein
LCPGGDAPPSGGDGGQVVVAGLGGVALVEPGGQARAAGQELGRHIQAQAAFIREQHAARHAARAGGGTGVSQAGQRAPGASLGGCGLDGVQVHVKRPAQPPARVTARRAAFWLGQQHPAGGNRLAAGYQDQPGQLSIVIEPLRLTVRLILVRGLLRLVVWHLSPPVRRRVSTMGSQYRQGLTL